MKKRILSLLVKFLIHICDSCYRNYLFYIPNFLCSQIRAYDLSEVFYRTEDEKNYEVFKVSSQQRDTSNIASNEVDQEIEGQRLEQEILLRNELAKNGYVPHAIFPYYKLYRKLNFFFNFTSNVAFLYN